MSIEMDNPETPLEKVEAAANLVEQMMLAHSIKDETQFKKAHTLAGTHLFNAGRMLAEEDDEARPEDAEGIDFTGGARVAYLAYAANTNNKTHDGREMPAWEDLGERVQTAWEASVRQTIYMVLGIDHDLSAWAGWQREA